MRNWSIEYVPDTISPDKDAADYENYQPHHCVKVAFPELFLSYICCDFNLPGMGGAFRFERFIATWKFVGCEASTQRPKCLLTPSIVVVGIGLGSKGSPLRKVKCNRKFSGHILLHKMAMRLSDRAISETSKTDPHARPSKQVCCLAFFFFGGGGGLHIHYCFLEFRNSSCRCEQVTFKTNAMFEPKARDIISSRTRRRVFTTSLLFADICLFKTIATQQIGLEQESFSKRPSAGCFTGGVVNLKWLCHDIQRFFTLFFARGNNGDCSRKCRGHHTTTARSAAWTASPAKLSRENVVFRDLFIIINTKNYEK